MTFRRRTFGRLPLSPTSSLTRRLPSALGDTSPLLCGVAEDATTLFLSCRKRAHTWVQRRVCALSISSDLEAPHKRLTGALHVPQPAESAVT